MKYIILFFVFIISLQSFSQSTGTVTVTIPMPPEIRSLIDSTIKASPSAVSIDSFQKSLEKIYLKSKISSGTFVLDTLTCDNNTAASFHLEIIGGTTGRGYKWVTINNVNGVYNIVGNVNLSSFTGITGALFEVVKISNAIVVRITSPSVTSWKLKRY